MGKKSEPAKPFQIAKDLPEASIREFCPPMRTDMPDITFGSQERLKAACQLILSALEAGTTPSCAPEDIPCFDPAALNGDPWVKPEDLKSILQALAPADTPVFQRALKALDASEQAWLGFKVVTDPAAAIEGKDGGSADALPAVFLVTNATGERQNAQILCGRPFSERDRRQMLDISRGPQMHGEQFPGVAWKSVPLFRQTRVFILGAGTVAVELAHLNHRLGFDTVVVDDETAFLNPERFPHSERRLIGSFDAMPDLGIGSEDFVCVLTRGHVHDPQALVHAIQAGAAYVGMMGRSDKNERIFDLAEQAGIERSAFGGIHAPIGLKFGAKSPAELAVSIAAELIQVRQDRRKAGQAKDAQ